MKEITAYQCKITLVTVTPLVWRRFVVLSNMSLNNLSWSLNEIMGWNSSHLYLFDIAGEEYGPEDPDDYCEWENDKKIKIRDLVAKGIESFKYKYDFGDDWNHEVLIEKEIQAEPKKRYPFCLEGENACPPEDCGGPYRFALFKEAMANSRHPEHQEFSHWYGRAYDPSHFDPQFTNFRMISKKIPSNFVIKVLPQKN